MAFNPLPIIALAVGATLLFTRKDEPKPKPKPKETDDSAPIPSEDPDQPTEEQRDTVTGSVESPFGDVPFEARPAQGGYHLWVWSPENNDWQTIEEGGSAKLFADPDAAGEYAANLIETAMAKVDIKTSAEFQVVKSGNSPMTLAPNKPGDTAMVRNIEDLGEAKYRTRLAGTESYEDYVHVAGISMGPDGPYHPIVTSTNGARPADALSVDYTPKGAADNVRLPLVVM